MNNDKVMILLNEKERLENRVTFARERLLQVSAPAIIKKIQKDLFTGEDVEVSYIELDKFTPEQREQFEINLKLVDENMARLVVFENFVRGQVPYGNDQQSNQNIHPLYEDKKVSISCDNIMLDENGKFSRYSIKVGPMNVESPRNMIFDEYSKLYTTSLLNLLTNSFDNGTITDENWRQLGNACMEVCKIKKKTL